MFAIVNRTPLSVALIPAQDAQGRDAVTLLIKGSFRFGGRGVLPELEEEQAPIVWADEYLGRPGESSVAIEAETSPPAGATDVALVGQAYAGRKPRAVVDVGLRVGPLGKRLRVHGDRVWRRRLGTFSATKAEPFTSLPLAYEHAYGGRDESHKDPARHACDQRNPVGRGFIAPGRGAQVEGVALPNIEDPDHEIRKPDDRPAPAGFGF
ncbi:MAG: DUF2169 domain-containing protein, partial [Candidatus Eisenbacteria bacterium]